ncbi:hypothetical protein [Roseicella aquatilis]|uniref:DUF5723 domain-containing protein n=1 Tax=Roseicella aquatilis TaxID=2527868 RepID=A0A4R4DJA8_9PROT|nr:hypothetical protein [Roseicella aquatilis]TCZ61253.1 hypothetical protein EXY23_11935 [Roseicella aquatilis]
MAGQARARVRTAAALLLMLAGGAARAQSVPLPGNPVAIGQLNEDVAYSLFLLTNGGFTSAGQLSYQDESTRSNLSVYTLPLRLPVQSGLLGPLELRLTGGYGEATTTTLQSLTGFAASPAGALATERQYISLWNLRLDVGRPITLLPGLVLTPMLGLGSQHWSGKIERNPVAGSPVSRERVDFWTDGLLAEAAAILEYRQPWRGLNIRPGASVSTVTLASYDGRATLAAQPPAPSLRDKATLAADSTVLRAALRVDGPLGTRLGATELRWQSFVVGNYSTAAVGLFPWSVELGLAVGAELGALGRSLVGFDPGEFYVGASYITGANFSGVRANFGFRF